MLREVHLDDFNVQVTCDWTCPCCGTKNTESYSHGPYTAPAYDPVDLTCSNKACEERFYTANFFEEGYPNPPR